VKVSVCAPAFELDPCKEIRSEGLTHLASYVGEGDGYLSPALEQAARLLDGGFDGLCVHAVPRIDSAVGPSNFTIGIILGPSGSGKTSLARERFGEPLVVCWDEEFPALAHFGSIAEAEAALSAVALDLETAMRPVQLLSGGERERLTLAWGLSEWAARRQKTLVFDEFTSLLDRQVAKQVAHGVTTFAQAQLFCTGCVLLASHKDIIGQGWLEPDWAFECDTLKFLMFPRTRPDATVPQAAKRRRVSIENNPQGSNSMVLTVRRALPCEWRHFREHHYKDHRLAGSSLCFVGELDGRAIAFSAVMSTGFPVSWILAPNKSSLEAKEVAERIGYSLDRSQLVLREHRTVILPDFQGLGLGSLMADMVASLCAQMGYGFMSTSAHPTYGGYRDRSPFWAALPSNKRERKGSQCSTFSHLWLGAPSKDGNSGKEMLRAMVDLTDTALVKAMSAV